MILVQDPPLFQSRPICKGLIVIVLLDILMIAPKKTFL